MPDLRYHLISLISVFLALAVGVLLGTALADRGVRDAQIQDIRNDLERQRTLISERDEDISELQQQLSTNEAVIRSMSETVVSNRLNGQNIALVSGPWVDEDLAQEVQSSLSTAGADVVNVVELPEAENFPVEDSSGGEAGLVPEYAAAARQLVLPQTIGDLSTTASDLSNLDVVVFLGGGEPPPEVSRNVIDLVNSAESRMFDVWSEVAGLRVVAAESAAGDYSQVPFFREENLSSVDNVDSPAGRAALVLLISGDTSGAYGVKPTASAPFPPPPS